MVKKQIEARLVLAIILIDVRVQWPRVDEKRYRPTSPRKISSTRSEIVFCPLRPALAAESRFALPPR